MRTSAERPLPLPAVLRWLRRWEFPRKLGFCDRLFGRVLAKHGICWVRTAPGPVWKLDLTNQTHRWIVYGYYEGPSFWRWLRAHRAAIHSIVDSGANIGQTLLYFAALAPAARVLAYEPGHAARAWLTEGSAANPSLHVIIEPAALGARTGAARLAADGGDDRHGSWNKVSASEGEPILMTTLDEELARHGITTLDLWKLDMEGYELEALRGAERALEAGRIRVVYIEATGEEGRASLDFLTTKGYRIHGIKSSGALMAWNPRHAYENALCLAPGEPA